jgi:hypothetical protein
VTDEQNSDRTDDPTPVVPPREFLAESIGHLEDYLRRAARAADAAQGLVRASGSLAPGALDEIEQLLVDVEQIAEGSRRTLQRYRDAYGGR